jgi:hypothetical protein
MLSRCIRPYLDLAKAHSPTEARRLPLHRILPVCLFLAGPAVTNAQAIVGRVLEDDKRAAIAGAEIALLQADGSARTQTVTDSAGRFHLAVAGDREYRLRVRHVAYTTIDSNPIKVASGETVRVEIRLAQARIPLEPLIVTVRSTDPRTAEFHERRLTAPSGRFLTRSEIERRSAARTTDLLRTMPGVTVVAVQSPGRTRVRHLIRMRGAGNRCDPAIYIDGLLIRQSPETPIDDLLSPSALDGVEVYSSTSNAPARYAIQGSCGVVLFWTGVGEAGSRKWSWKQVLGGAAVAAALIGLLVSR